MLVLADKAYTSRANRRYLRSCGIKAGIPSKKDQDAHRKAKGSRGRHRAGSHAGYAVAVLRRPRPVRNEIRWAAEPTATRGDECWSGDVRWSRHESARRGRRAVSHHCCLGAPRSHQSCGGRSRIIAAAISGWR
ncbi:hypothetical protein Aau02nite_29360 [Amorphoplanes auranticolor]|uniref:DDE family transposase n=1 Tax=Actinoplanes auranticolor TaxID=47988 RepID=A0A919VLJ4_9ACTN|nr:hypothetical protein Aau02nite_29360 [Actinoplanes auranticolor]